MPSATSSGADGSTGGTARHREHNQGNQDRTYTPEQAAAVLRIRRCQATAFYEILDIQRTVTSGEVKKAYRKQSLLTHPDKNSHPHADEAFKMVSRAFGVLGDKDKRDKFDRFGTDPDSRFGGGASASSGPGPGMQNPFASRAGGMGGMGGMGGGMWEDEISPEEMFRRFFGGGGFPFGAGFDTGPQFVFNMGGGPGFRVHQFGGARPRMRPRQANMGTAAGGQQPRQEQSLLSTLIGLLPIFVLFVLPLLSSLFSGDGGAGGSSQPAMPRMVFDAPQAPFTLGRQTPSNVKYYVDPREFAPFQDNAAKLSQLDNYADVTLVRTLRGQCEREMVQRQRLREDAQGWIFQDPEKMALANTYEMKSCSRLERMNPR